MSAPATAAGGTTRWSITTRIGLQFGLIFLAVVAGMGFTVDRILERELLREGEVVLLGNMALIRGRIERLPLPQSVFEGHRFAELAEIGYTRLNAALLEPGGEVIDASAGWGMPAGALPARALPVGEIPRHVDSEVRRALHERLGGLSNQWFAPDGRRFQVMLASMMVGGGNVPAREARIALSFERSLSTDLLMRYRKGLLETMLIGCALAALASAWVARRMLGRVKRLTITFGSIDVNALDRRLTVANLPAELVDPARAFNAMLDRLQDSFRRLTDFASDMAHDLRTPINNLLGEAQVALAKPRSAAEFRIALESAIEEYERLSRMMENMLFLARADNAKASLAPVSLQASRSIARVLSYFEMLAEDRSITLVARCEPGLTVRADAIMFERALGNLMSNALRHAPAGSEVTVRALAAVEGAARIEVENRGADIAPEYLDVVFDRFRRVGAARESAGGGAGLGLAIVKSIMALHGGSAGVASAGGTTVFTLHFLPGMTLAPDSRNPSETPNRS